MATDEVMYDSDRRSSHLGLVLHTSQYARVDESRRICVRGSVAEPWYNHFSPDEARRLARYILALADDAEEDPAIEELSSDIGVIWQTYDGTTEEFARALIARGYHR